MLRASKAGAVWATCGSDETSGDSVSGAFGSFSDHCLSSVFRALVAGAATLEVGFAWAITRILERTTQAQTRSMETTPAVPIAM